MDGEARRSVLEAVDKLSRLGLQLDQQRNVPRTMEDQGMTALDPTPSAPTAHAARRLPALAAIIAGPLFLAITAVITLVELDFMHDLGWSFTGDDDVPWPSGLVLGTYGAAQIVNFALAGLLLFFFVRSFRHEFQRRRSGRVASVLLTAWTLAFTALAFPTDRATAAADSPNTWHGSLHVAAFVVVIIASLAAPIAVAIALRGNEHWRGFPALSVGVAVAAFAFFLSPFGDSSFVGFLIVMFGWFAALGLRFRNVSSVPV